MLTLLLLLACPPGTTPNDDTGGTTGDPSALSAIQAETLTPSCAFSGCHATAAPGGELDLTDGHTWANVVNVASSVAAGETLVIPGDSAGSYLVKKSTAASGIEGDPMPSGSPTGLDAARLANIVAWIDAGALDN